MYTNSKKTRTDLKSYFPFVQPGLTVFKLTLVHLDFKERKKKRRQEYT